MYSVEILAPTFLEYWAVRRTLPHARTSWAGVRLARWKGARQGSIVVVCGLAGALAPGVRPGTVLIPDWVGLADGRIMHCDPTLVQALVTAARTLHFRPDTGPLLTAQSIIVGGDRHDWSQRGCISPDWLRPTRALLQPLLWRELFWLSRVAPQYALRAAHVLKVGLGTGQGRIFAE